MRDRIVQQALLQVLHPVMEPQFDPASFAYRPGRSHLMAVRQVAQWRDRDYDWVLDADIVKYFDNIRHDRLLAEVKERVNLPWVLELVRAWVEVGVLTKEGILLPQKGVPQGSVISPLLSNIYLDDFDEALASQGRRLVRFADDFVVLSRTRQWLLEGKDEVARLLGEMGLHLHPNKTRITHFDKGFRFLGHAFAGDVIVPVKKPKRSQPEPIDPQPNLTLVHSDTLLTGPTMMQQALIEALKQQQQPIPPPLFVVMGYQVRREKPIEITSQEIVWSNGMSSLYVVQQGTYLHKEQGRFILRPPKGETLEVLIREVERILVFGNVQLSTAVIATCLQLNIPVVFLSQLGDYKGHLWSAEVTDLVVEAAQFRQHPDTDFRATVAKSIVRGKLWNSRLLLVKLNRRRRNERVQSAIASLWADLERLKSLDIAFSLNTLRGYEGSGALRYFKAFGRLITNPGFEWQRRTFHPPTDPINAMLSFGYTLLLNNVLSMLLVEGLNPYLGNLHGAERKKAYLAFDLMEEFRSPIVDTLVMRLINQKIIRPTDFTWPNQKGGVYITGPAKRVFLNQFEQRMSLKVSHPDMKGPVTYRRVIQLQIQRYKRTLLNGQAYLPYERTI